MEYSIAFFGTPQFSVPVLRALHQSFEVKLVVSQPDKPVGKGLHTQPSPVSMQAKELGLPLLTPAKLNDEQFKSNLQATPVDVAVVLAYGKILPKWLLDWPRFGAVNIHGSLLPYYRGASPINAAILQGDSETGLTLIRMNERMDEGDMLASTPLPIQPSDTALTLSEKMSDLAAKWIGPVLNDYLEGNLVATPQDHTLATYTGILEKSAGQIDLNNPPSNLSNMIRAYYPWPGVWGIFGNKRVKLLPGQMVQMEGKKPTPLTDFLRGYPGFPLTNF